MNKKSAKERRDEVIENLRQIILKSLPKGSAVEAKRRITKRYKR